MSPQPPTHLDGGGIAEAIMRSSEADHARHGDASVTQLSQKLLHQIVVGCGDLDCPQQSCFTYRTRNSSTPARRPSPTTARVIALALMARSHPERFLCERFREDRTDADTSVCILGQECRLVNAAGRKKKTFDKTSFEQQLFHSQQLEEKPWKSTELLQSVSRSADEDSSQYIHVHPPMSAIDLARYVTARGVMDCPLDRFGATTHYSITFLRAICCLRMRRAQHMSEYFRKLLANQNTWYFDLEQPLHRLAEQMGFGLGHSGQLAVPAFRAVMEATLPLQVRRDHLLADAFDQLWHIEPTQLLRPIVVQVRSEAEVGQDQGGVGHEFFRLAIQEAFRPEYGVMSVDEDSHMAWFDPRSVEPPHKFELLGLLFALAVHNGFTLSVNFPLAFYAKLSGRLPDAPALEDIRDGWPRLHQSFEQILAMDEGVEDLGLSYVFPRATLDSQSRDVDLRDPTSSSDPPQDEPATVTNENKHVYIAAYIAHLLHHSTATQFTAFSRGVYAVIPQTYLRMMPPAHLKSSVEGSPEVSSATLEAHATYEDIRPDGRAIRTFWRVVHSWPPERVRKMLEFVTASDRLPMAGPQALRFVIKGNGRWDVDDKLPTASTCFSTLLLPEYSSQAVMEKKLEIAVDNSVGFGNP